MPGLETLALRPVAKVLAPVRRVKFVFPTLMLAADWCDLRSVGG